MIKSIWGYGCIKTAISYFFVMSLFFGSSAEASENQYLDSILFAAKERRIYKERYWEILLHYKKKSTGFKSLVDDPQFFLSPDGNKSPEKELEATIKAFFQSDETDDSHPRCRFVARYDWLKKELNIDESKLPPVSCREFDEAYSKIKPKSAVLVFPSAYINGPASTFGHTLIRIDSDYQSKLISYAATYSAFADDTNGVLYAFKGIFGFYKGYFTILPYYEKIKEYNDLEQRDIWEYKLNLSEDEASRLLLHLWELKDRYSHYYFFDENCSYALLSLLEAARPSLHLTDDFNLWVIPIDTVRSIETHGLVDNIKYRPSRGTKIRHIASLLDDSGQELTAKIVKNEVRADDVNRGDSVSVKVLDLAAEVVQARYNKKDITKEDYQRQFLSILKVRSKFNVPGEREYNIGKPPRPEEGHGSSRLSLGLGLTRDDLFQEIRYRAAQHELSDPGGGYIEGSEIVFFGLTLRNIPNRDGVRLENLDVIDIVSISPRDKFFKPVSWKVKTGLLQKTMHDGSDALVYQLNPGGGFAYKNDLVGLYCLLVETDLNVGGGYEDNFSLGVGPSIGVIRGITRSWKMNLFANAFYYELGDRHKAYKVSAQQVVGLSQNNSVNLDLSWKREFDIEQNELKLNWNLYF